MSSVLHVGTTLASTISVEWVHTLYAVTTCQNCLEPAGPPHYLLLLHRIPIEQIAILGKWDNNHMVKSYVNGIPLAAVLDRAGHMNMLHLLPRSTIEPPKPLLDLIFPGVEQMLEKKQQVGCSICNPLAASLYTICRLCNPTIHYTRMEHEMSARLC